MNFSEKQHNIHWDPHYQHPFIQLKEGILRKQFVMNLKEHSHRDHFEYWAQDLKLECRWKALDEDRSVLHLELSNCGKESVRLTRLTFPAENGIEDFVRDFAEKELCFLRNGYQSWSTARSYRPTEKPLRPWLQLVSQVSSNMANLPSNIPGIYSSEMYTLLSEKDCEESFLVGQGASFSQFFYIKINLRQGEQRSSDMEFTYDFGRKLLSPGETISLDSIYMSRGPRDKVLKQYSQWVNKTMKIQVPPKPVSGYGTWYYFFEKITPADIRRNLAVMKERQVPLEIFQIDDGYQSQVGDWLEQSPEFVGQMKVLADEIRAAGYRPGLWISPFVTNSASKLATHHPDYLLRNEYGRKLIGGYNPWWKGNVYYGLDITYPRFEEYLRKIIRTIVHEWGFTFLKCDFLFGACLRGAIHYDIHLTRAQILRRGMEIIREEAGPEVLIEGCGMPLVTGVGLVDIMRVGPDTGPYWVKKTGKILRTGAMMGVRNSIRNTFVRSMMHKKFWQNDPDCLMLREEQTRLNKAQRRAHINTIILSGGVFFISDELSRLSEENWEEFEKIRSMNHQCFSGELIPCDIMEREVPEILMNTAGFLGLFNIGNRKRRAKKVHICHLPEGPVQLKEVWSGMELSLKEDHILDIPDMGPYGSLLFAFK